MSNVIISKQEQVLTIALNRPARKNALTQAMYEEMTQALRGAYKNEQTRVVIISGSEDCFCAGNDLAGFPKNPSKSGPTFVWDFLETVIRAPYPILAAVNGVSAGIGSTMLLHLDGVIASPESRIHFSFINMALVPEAGSSLLLPRLMGYTKAANLLMRGHPLSGQEAYELGIVSSLVNSDDVDTHARKIALELARKPPQALRRTKALLKGDNDALLTRIKTEEAELFAQLASQEFRDSLEAFVKRPK